MARFTREQINLRPPKSRETFSESKGVFIHYTAGGHSRSADKSKSSIRGIQKDHMNNRGWDDIAYSFLVDDAGNIFEGRGWGVVGAHTKGHNDEAHAIAYLGKNGTPTKAALQSINAIIDEHDAKYGEGYVRRHKDVGRTSCPGPFLSQWVEDGRPVAGGSS